MEVGRKSEIPIDARMLSVATVTERVSAKSAKAKTAITPRWEWRDLRNLRRVYFMFV